MNDFTVIPESHKKVRTDLIQRPFWQWEGEDFNRINHINMGVAPYVEKLQGKFMFRSIFIALSSSISAKDFRG